MDEPLQVKRPPGPPPSPPPGLKRPAATETAAPAAHPGKRPGGPPPANVLVTPDDAPQNEPAVAVHILNPAIMLAAANDYRGGHPSQIGIYRSPDGGFTWDNRLAPLPPGHVASGDPVVCYGFPNRFLVGGAAYNGVGEEGGGSIIAYHSEDGGATFSPPVIVQEGFNEQTFNDKPWFAVDTAPASPYQGRAYVIYTRFMDPGTIILFHRSEDGGRTWSGPMRLTDIEPYSLGTFVAIGQLGEVYVAWMRDAEAVRETSLVFRRSLDGGLTFEEEVTVARFERPEVEQGLARFVPTFTFRLFTFAFLGVDQTTGPEGGRLFAVWHQIVRQRDGKRRHGDDHHTRETVNVMISVSDDRGATWTRPRQASNLPVGAVAFYPFVSVSPKTGTVNLLYYTNLIFENLLDVYLIRIINHGRRFLPARMVTNVSFNPNAAPLGDAFIGDYIGCAARPDMDRAVAVWCDTRRGSEDIFAAPQA